MGKYRITKNIGCHFLTNRKKNYKYNNDYSEITASTDDNGGNITDEIKFNINKNSSLLPRTSVVNFTQKGGKTATYKIYQREGSKSNRPSVVDYSTLSLSVTPDNSSVSWDETSYRFTATLAYDNVVYWFVDEADPMDKEHEISRTRVLENVTNDSTWSSTTVGVDATTPNGTFIFPSNTVTTAKTISVSATYNKDGHSVTDSGSIIQGLPENFEYKLTITPNSLIWMSNEEGIDYKKTVTIESQYRRGPAFNWEPCPFDFTFNKTNFDGSLDTLTNVFTFYPNSTNCSMLSDKTEKINITQRNMGGGAPQNDTINLKQLEADVFLSDYLVLRYDWGKTDGGLDTDLDTATLINLNLGIVTPTSSLKFNEVPVGTRTKNYRWNENSEINTFMKYGGFNC